MKNFETYLSTEAGEKDVKKNEAHAVLLRARRWMDEERGKLGK
jgi:hypothetical protein